MNYKIFSINPQAHVFTVEISIETRAENQLLLQLPAWRPGRYELQNFAKNISRFEIIDEKKHRPSFKKNTKDCWQIDTRNSKTLNISFDFFAKKRDAGNSFVDESLLYINPVNCCPYVVGRENEPLTLELPLAVSTKTVIGLQPIETGVYKANNFYELADSPFLISNTLQEHTYEVANTTFHVWFEGNFKPDWPRIIQDFKAFTKAQVDIFGEFPEPVYHFITWILPEAFYHGVEHRNSTMMVLGPDAQAFETLYIDLLGLASHELFHAWNICKIRPKELMPYDYTKENYFETCYVSEGVTTYYGDLVLYRSGVFDRKQYLHELETCYRRHFENADSAWQSLSESSFDLWLDGYVASVPNRKVSVYHKGAIAAQVLDLLIQKQTNNAFSLDTVMKLMWERFGKTGIGFAAADYRTICEEVAGENLDWYFDIFIDGRTPVLSFLNEALLALNLSVEWNDGYVRLIELPIKTNDLN